MKKPAFLLLCAAAAVDVFQRAYNSDLLGTIANRAPGQGVLWVVLHSPVMTTLGHWGLFLLGFGILSLAMSGGRRSGPDILG